jgi:hypothetical protein
MNGHFLPYRSAAKPKMILPTDRSIKTRVIPHVMSAFVLSNDSANSVTVSETVKKSNASHDHAKKATRKKSHCWRLSMRRSVNGFGTLSCAGFSVVMRVAAYLPAVILGAGVAYSCRSVFDFSASILEQETVSREEQARSSLKQMGMLACFHNNAGLPPFISCLAHVKKIRTDHCPSCRRAPTDNAPVMRQQQHDVLTNLIELSLSNSVL